MESASTNVRTQGDLICVSAHLDSTLLEMAILVKILMNVRRHLMGVPTVVSIQRAASDASVQEEQWVVKKRYSVDQ